MKDILYEGKSKTICRGRDDDTFILHYKDTATALNGEKKEEIKGKGRINAEISELIYGYLAEHGIETHLIEVIDETTVLVKKAEIIPVEVIIRNIAAGSFCRKYGIQEKEALKNTVVEFSLKNDELGDPMINENQITAIGLAEAEELKEMKEQALYINELLSLLFAKAKIKLADFKLEFGRYCGRIILCDEISPDSCRLWDEDTGRKLDKDIFRQDLGDVLSGYDEILRRLQGVR